MPLVKMELKLELHGTEILEALLIIGLRTIGMMTVVKMMTNIGDCKLIHV